LSDENRFLRRKATAVAIQRGAPLDADGCVVGLNNAYHEVGKVQNAEPTKMPRKYERRRAASSECKGSQTVVTSQQDPFNAFGVVDPSRHMVVLRAVNIKGRHSRVPWMNAHL